MRPLLGRTTSLRRRSVWLRCSPPCRTPGKARRLARCGVPPVCRRLRYLVSAAVDTTHKERVEFRSGEEMWNWVLGSNPIARTIVGDLPEDQQATVRQVLDGMLRERSGGNGPAVLTAPLNIGVGTK